MECEIRGTKGQGQVTGRGSPRRQTQIARAGICVAKRRALSIEPGHKQHTMCTRATRAHERVDACVRFGCGDLTVIDLAQPFDGLARLHHAQHVSTQHMSSSACRRWKQRRDGAV